MRRIARIEQSATPITNTKTVIGLRNAALNSHILTALPASSDVATPGTAGHPLVPRRQRPCSAKPQAAREHRQSPTALTNSPPQKPLQLSPSLLGILHASASPFRVRLRVPPALLPLPVALLLR